MLELKRPTKNISGTVKLPGSKSISNRLLILQQVIGSDLEIANLSDSEDTVLLINALQQINTSASALIDVNHAGTDMRFLTALLALRKGKWTLTGSQRMQQRPISPLVNALKQMGAAISYGENDGYPPLIITGSDQLSNKVELDAGMSSQFLSALLLIAPALPKGLEIKIRGKVVSRPYVQMTMDLLRAVGVVINDKGDTISLEPYKAEIPSGAFTVESDWSAASYYYSICSLSPGSEIRLKNFFKKSMQGDSVLREIYKSLGVSTTFEDESIVLRNIEVETEYFKYDFTDCPDIAQTVAVTCFAHKVPAQLTGLKTLKHKESDRMEALKLELIKLGAHVSVTEESLTLDHSPLNPPDHIRISTYDDHRMAMSFAPLSLVVPQVIIEDPTVVNKSYPHFWDDLESLGFSVNLQP